MKLMKYTFSTPLSGSIECEELLPDTNGRIDLSPEQMARMYDRTDSLMRFLTENMEDLAAYVPEELKNVVLRAEFGDFAMRSSRMYLHTHIWTVEKPTEEEMNRIQSWITGQMSDGWGEGLEQRAWDEEQVKKPILYFDEYSLEFEEDEETYWVNYYVHPWNSDDFEIYLEDQEEVEEPDRFEIVGTVSLPHHNRQVLKFSGGLALKMFLKNFNQMDMARWIEDACPRYAESVYIVRDMDGNSGVEILPRWVCEESNSCKLYDLSIEEELKSTSMALSVAILELLK